MKQDIYLGMGLVHEKVDQIKVFVITNNARTMINPNMNAKN